MGFQDNVLLIKGVLRGMIDIALIEGPMIDGVNSLLKPDQVIEEVCRLYEIKRYVAFSKKKLGPRAEQLSREYGEMLRTLKGRGDIRRVVEQYSDPKWFVGLEK